MPSDYIYILYTSSKRADTTWVRILGKKGKTPFALVDANIRTYVALNAFTRAQNEPRTRYLGPKL